MKSHIINMFNWWRSKPIAFDLFWGALIAFGLAALGFNKEDVVDLFVSLFSVFVGASLAFKIDSMKDKGKIKEKQIKDLNMALFSIGRMINAIEVMKKPMEPYINNDIDLAFTMGASKNVEYSDIKFDYGALDFILDSSDKTLLLELSIERERFEQVLSSIQIRSEFYVNEYQPIFESKGLSGKRITADELKALIGERIYGACLSSSQAMKELLLDSRSSLPKTQERLFNVGRELFPGVELVKFLSRAPVPAQASQAAPPQKGKKDNRRQSKN